MNAIARLIDHAKETYPHFESPRGQADIAAAAAERDALTARVAELEAALREAISLVCQWHDSGGEKVAYRFDLTDHPQVMPLYAALAKGTA